MVHYMFLDTFYTNVNKLYLFRYTCV